MQFHMVPVPRKRSAMVPLLRLLLLLLLPLLLWVMLLQSSWKAPKVHLRSGPQGPPTVALPISCLRLLWSAPNPRKKWSLTKLPDLRRRVLLSPAVPRLPTPVSLCWMLMCRIAPVVLKALPTALRLVVRGFACHWIFPTSAPGKPWSKLVANYASLTNLWDHSVMAAALKLHLPPLQPAALQLRQCSFPHGANSPAQTHCSGGPQSSLRAVGVIYTNVSA
mmetsp:Transcript_63882/g.122816  ORF Transcript_63882/g.122816 Transcript_63882/m.122816 type:complete len:221 (-) Transcript_63882:2032-2694(-)